MTEPLTPQTIETLAAGYVVGDLDPAEVVVFEQLLADNSALVTQVKQLQVTQDQVAHALNCIEPPAHLRSAILAAATTPIMTAEKAQTGQLAAQTAQTAQTAQLTAGPHRTQRQGQKIWHPLIGKVMGTFAALLIVYLGAENYGLRQDRQIAQDINQLLQQTQTQFFALKAVKATDSRGGDVAVGGFIVNLGQRQGILTVQNLANPPANKVYRLWAIADGEKIPCGTLNINAQGKVLEKFWMPADFYDTGISGLFVTMESSALSRYPTGPVVMQSG
jgi:hypothetical protein